MARYKIEVYAYNNPDDIIGFYYIYAHDLPGAQIVAEALLDNTGLETIVSLDDA